jgi:hypothetical protein
MSGGASIADVDGVARFSPETTASEQLRGLALLRSGNTIKAQLVLGRLYAGGEIAPDTLGILARTWMDRYHQSGEKIFLLNSRDIYRQAFEASPTDYYPGINAASKSALAGEKETAAQLAKRVQDLIGDKAVPGDYWKTTTVAEVQLLQGNVAAAADLYHGAVQNAPYDQGSHKSSHGQAKLLLSAIGATDNQKARIDAAFPPHPLV